MAKRSRLQFVRGFLSDLLHHNYVDGDIGPADYFPAKREVIDDWQVMRHVSAQLFENRGRDVDIDQFGPLRLIELRDLRRKPFPFILITPQSKRERIQCFVGCRFAQGIPQLLEFNLRTILDPWNVDVKVQNANLAAGALFDTIIRGIERADFCIFDNRGTFERPNVYIEAGIAYAMGRPMIFCEYIGRAVGDLKTIRGKETVPSDLAGLSRVQYRNYEDLCRQIYLRFPRFLQEAGMSG